MSNCKTSSLASSSTASKSNFNLLSHSTIPKPQTLEILLVEPMFMPEIHTKDGFQRWKMRGEHPKCKGKCSKRISSSWRQLVYIQSGLILFEHFPLHLGCSPLIFHRWKPSLVWISVINMVSTSNISRV